MPTTEDRLIALENNATSFTGIDFVQVVEECDQTTLRVYFLTDPTVLVPPFTGTGAVPIEPNDIRIYSPRGVAPDVPVILCAGDTAFEWATDDDTGRTYLEICVERPGDFTDYRLLITDPKSGISRIDPIFNDVPFSFKVGCDTGLDCDDPPLECPEEPKVDFPVDYLARDFVSLRNALLDFAAQRLPEWTFPIEADVGVMLAEVMAAVGDEFSYVQDRYNREAYLATATERRSLRKKAQLVDYQIHDGRLATTFLELTIKDNPASEFVSAGALVWALSESGPPIPFEVGTGLTDETDFLVRPEWNRGEFELYCFDDSQACLPVGATELFIVNDPGDPTIESGDFAAWEGRLLLLLTEPTDPSVPARRHIVRVIDVAEVVDHLLGATTARIRWREEDALPFQICQEDLIVSGNVVPATAGETHEQFFRIGPLIGDDDPAEVLSTVEREGPLEPDGGRSIIHLASLPLTETGGLGFLDKFDNLRTTTPEIVVSRVLDDDPLTLDAWTFRRSLLLDSGDDESFTLEDGTWRRIVEYQRPGGDVVHRDYATQAGYTVRFGDGRFGTQPGQGDLFHVRYRLGPGARANVPADTITALNLPGQPVASELADVEAVTNPLPVTNGVDPESAQDIKLLTPEAYQAEVLFAVRPEDYGEQAEKLDFVQRAQGTLRWTGTWHSVIAAVDPFGRFTLTDEEREQLENHFDCVRQAGREVIVSDPKFVSIDLVVRLCVQPFAFAGQVKEEVLELLFGRRGIRPVKGFFDPDNFTFGTPLRRSALEAVLHDVTGVRSVLGMEIRPVGLTPFTAFTDLVFGVDPDQIIRLENNPLFPERGSLELVAEGGG